MQKLNHGLYSTNCVTGDDDHLYYRLKDSISRAVKIDIIGE